MYEVQHKRERMLDKQYYVLVNAKEKPTWNINAIIKL